jgi:hypothetical protein
MSPSGPSRHFAATRCFCRFGGEADINGRAGPAGSVANDPMYGPAVRCKRLSSIQQIWSCINVSGLCLERVGLGAIMDISAHSS